MDWWVDLIEDLILRLPDFLPDFQFYLNDAASI